MSLLKSAGTVLTLMVIGCSAWMNFEYMTGEGSSRSSIILGLLSVAFDLIKALLPIFIVAALAQGARLQALIAAVFLCAFILFGFVSALGFGESNKGERVTTREGLAAELRDKEADLAMARERLRGLHAFRPIATIMSELAALKKDRAWDRSKGCTEATTTISRDLCKAIDRFGAEAASAAERDVQTLKAERLEREVKLLRDRGAGREADPQASAIRRMLGHLFPAADNSVIRSSVAWLFATLVEGWSAFGLYLCGVRHQRPRHEIGADLRIDAVNVEGNGTIVTDQQAEPGPSVDDQMLRTAAWALKCVDFYDDGRIKVGPAYAEYQRAAALAGLRSLPLREFRKAMMIMAITLDYEIWGDELHGMQLSENGGIAAIAVPESENSVENGIKAA